ncbi:MAG: putative glycoside hydrolase [Candidatus Sericytochromatia bacterium]
MKIKKYLPLLISSLILISCEKTQVESTTNTSSSPNSSAITEKPKTKETPYPENYHSGYKTKLPDGGIYKNNQIIYTAPEPTYIETISDKFIDYTDYYTVTGMGEGLMKLNKLKSVYIGKGQKVIIDKVRKEAPNPKTIVKPKNFEARGVYITHTVAGGGYIFKIAKEMKKLKLNTLIIDAKDMDGHLAYKSNIPLAKEIGATSNRPPIRNLKKLIEMLHKDDFHVVMRQTLFHDELLGVKKPQFAPISKSTGKAWKETTAVVWVDPSKKEVQDYHLAISKELAEMGVDEIQYDYVRFPAWGNTKDAKYSFDEKKLKKHEIITDFLKRQRENLAPYKVLMSADVYGVVAWDQNVDMYITGQKIGDMAKYLDAISPMLYPSHFFPPFDGYSNPGAEPYHFLYAGVKRTRKKTLGTNVTIRPWIQAFTWKAPNYSPDYVYQQIKATNDAYAGGWLLWNAGNEYKTAFQGISKFKNKYPTQAELDKKLASSSDKGLIGDKKENTKTAQVKTEEDKTLESKSVSNTPDLKPSSKEVGNRSGEETKANENLKDGSKTKKVENKDKLDTKVSTEIKRETVKN